MNLKKCLTLTLLCGIMLLPLQGLFMSKFDLINAVIPYTVLCFQKVFNICLLYSKRRTVMREAILGVFREKNISVKREVPL